MYDVIGKRRWFYAFSLLVTIPGLVFLLLTPFTNVGLQFSVDFTGGTVWEIRFEDPAVTPEQVEEVFAAQGLEAVAITTGDGFIEIKTEPIGLAPVPEASPTPSLPAASGVPRRRPRQARPHRRRPRQARPPRRGSRPHRPRRPRRSRPAVNTNLPTTGGHG